MKVMADRGFEIENDLPMHVVKDTPPPPSFVRKHSFRKRTRLKLRELLNTGYMLRGPSKELKAFAFSNMICRYLWLQT
jgi:hypothetical protein